MEFPAPGISGSHEYEANVYYFIDGNWFNLGKGAVQNMTLEVTGTVTTLLEYSAEIEEVEIPETLGLDEIFQLDVTVSYDFDGDGYSSNRLRSRFGVRPCGDPRYP